MRKIKGFTLMEILVSLVILTTLSLGLASVFFAAQKGTSMSDDKIIAAQVAEKALGELRAASASDFKSWTQDLLIRNAVDVPELKSGKLSVKVGNFLGVSNPEYKELIATVTWTNATGNSKSLQLVTGIYKASND